MVGSLAVKVRRGEIGRNYLMIAFDDIGETGMLLSQKGLVSTSSKPE